MPVLILWRQVIDMENSLFRCHKVECVGNDRNSSRRPLEAFPHWPRSYIHSPPAMERTTKTAVKSLQNFLYTGSLSKFILLVIVFGLCSAVNLAGVE